MFFRRAIILIFLTLALGCGVHLDEKAPHQNTIVYSGKGFNCVGQIPQHLESYFNDELDAEQISSFMQCLQNSFTSFAQLTRGRDQATYEPSEIRNFLQSYFLKNRPVSDELMHQFMVIKQVLVGGTVDRITRPELFSAIDLLENVRVEAIRLKPHLKYLNSSLIVAQGMSDLGLHLNQANAAVKSSIEAFAARLVKSEKPYKMTDLASFMREFREFAGWETHFRDAHPVDQWISFFKIFKDITVSKGHPEEIQAGEWGLLLRSLARWYSCYLEYKVGIKGQAMMSGDGLQNTIYLGQQIFELVEEALAPDKTLTFWQMHKLVVSLHGLGWIPAKIRVASIDGALHAIVTRVFGDVGKKPSERRAEGITLMNLANMKSDFYRWVYTQEDLDAHFHPDPKLLISRPEQTVPVLQAPLTPDAPEKVGNVQGSILEDILSVRALIRPLFPEDVDRVFLVPEKRLQQFGVQKEGFYNLSVMNLLRSVVAMIFRGYGEDINANGFWQSGVHSEEMQKFYEDVRDMGIDLAIVDKRNVTSGSRAFIEGKLFTYSSRGLVLGAPGLAGELSFTETMEYFAFLYSGGREASQIFSDLLEICPNGPLDINGLAKVQRLCAFRELPKLMDRYMTNMPYLLEYLRKANVETRQQYIRTLMATAKTGNSVIHWMEKNEMSTIAVVTHYIEAVMTRYDVINEDGVLTNDELEAAVPVFSGFIKKIAHEKNCIPNWMLFDRVARAAFFFILDKHSMPGLGDWDGILRNTAMVPTVALDRLQLADVFKAIIQKLLDVSGSSKSCAPEAVMRVNK